MKIKTLNIKNYGCIDNKEIEFGKGISIIKGNNESGKSTTHQAILDMLFGFINMQKRGNSFRLSSRAQSHKGGFPRIDADILDESGEYSSARYFEGSTPKLITARGRIVTRSDNIPLEILDGMSRETYEGIYSLDIDQIVRLKDSWEREQDSILSGMQTDILLPNDIIMQNIDDSIKKTWRGKTITGKSKEVKSEISQTKLKMNEAYQNQQKLREIENNTELAKENITRCRKEIEILEKEKIEYDRQKIFYTEYSEIDNIISSNCSVKKYEQLPRDILNVIYSNTNESDNESKKAEELNKKIQNLNGDIEKYKHQKEKIKQFKEMVPLAESTAQELKVLKERLSRDREKEKEKRKRILAKVRGVFRDNFTWEDFNILIKTDIGECMNLWNSIVENRAEKSDVMEAAREKISNNEKRIFRNIDKMDILMFLIMVIGGLIMFLPLGISRTITLITGASIFAGAAAAFIFRISRFRILDRNELIIELDRIDDEYERLRTKLRKQLDHSFIPSEFRNNPSESLIKDIAALKEDYIEYTEVQNELKKDAEEAEEKEEMINQSAKILLGSSKDFLYDINSMRTELKKLIILENDAENAGSQIKILNLQLLEIKNRVYTAQNKIKEISDVLFELEGSDINKKAQKLMDMREEYALAQGRMEQLKQKNRDFDTLVKESGSSVEQKLYDVKSEIDRIESALIDSREYEKELINQIGRMDTDRKHLLESGLMPAVIESRLNELEDEKKARILLRDEYVLAYSIIQKARGKFISQHSPEFLDNASEYLAQITDGRYNKISLNRKGTSIIISGGERTYDFDQIDEILSRGTKEQAYLALRLAMLERFDPADNKLPIVLDEALVNWDSDRFTKLIEIMGDIASERQVFLFTCHDYVVDIINSANKEYQLINI